MLHETAILLQLLVSAARPKKVLEIGTAIGYSSILIKDNAPLGCTIDTIEKKYDMVVKARENIRRAGYEKYINIIYGDALEVLASLWKKYDMIFIDAAKIEYNEYLRYASDLLDNGALLIADNILFKGMVNDHSYEQKKYRSIIQTLRTFNKNISERKDLLTSVFNIGDGVSVSFRREIIEKVENG